MNPEISHLLPEPLAPVEAKRARIDWLVLISIAFFAILGTACQSTPTPTVVPIPTATFFPTEAAPDHTPTPTPLPTSAPIRAVVTDTLRVREEPNTASKILGRLKQDTVVMLIARKDDNQWFEIEYPPGSGDAAWISADIVVPDTTTDQLPIGFTSPLPPPGAIFAKVLVRSRFRTGPGKDYDTLDRVAAGARVTILARSEDSQWFQITDPRDSNKRAWMALQDQDTTLLELLGAADQLPIAPVPPTPTPGPTPIPRPTRTPGPGGPAGTARILVSSNRAGAYDIYSIAENGAVRQRLTSFGESFGARFSPDGNQIVFYHTVATSPYVASHIFVMNANGSGIRDLSSAGGASDTDPDWSPDGKRIVFVRTARAGGSALWVMNTNGAGAHRIVSLSPATGISSLGVGDFSIHPRWSPDGGRIAYAAVPRAENPGAPLYPNIFVVNADGSGETQLTDNDLINSNPSWSPDGKQIAWAAKDFINRQNWRVWVMSAAGGSQRTAISQLQGDTYNGVQIAEWVGNRWLLAGWNGNWNAFFANSDGSKVTSVTSDSADNRPTDWLP